jgi:Actin like proteins N terminal domain
MAYIRLNLGYDRGNERTNAAVISDSGKIIEMDMPSLIAEGNLTNHTNVRSGSSVNDVVKQLHPNETYVVFDGITYFVGDFANQGDNPTNGYSDMNRYRSKHTKISLMACAATLASRLYSNQSQEIAVNLVMGVPIQAYKDEAQFIAHELRGEYRFNFNGRDYTMHVDAIKVFMEGAGAAIYNGLDASASIGIVDSGSFTTNILRFDGVKANARECASFPIGVGTAIKRLNTWFEQEYGRDLSFIEQQSILRASIANVAYPVIWSDGKEVSTTLLAEWMRKAIDETGIDRNTNIGRLWPKQTIKSFKTVLHVGGGAYYFDTSLQKISKTSTVVGDAEKVNARGYAALANQIALRQMQRGA